MRPLALLLLVGCAHSAPIPSPHWEHAPQPVFTQALDYAHTLNTSALMVVIDGKVVLETGDVTRESYVASVRKSVLAMLMGIDRVRLDATLDELGIDDLGGLTPEEKQATVADLLISSSGIYHPASNPGDDTAEAPARASQKHGTYFLYNNWDFNVLGAIFEQQTHHDIYDAFERDLAQPLGMEDFHRAAQKKSGDASASRYLAYHFTLSTRDLARLGLLMLYQGNWGGRQLIPVEWVREITKVHVKREALHPARTTTGPFGYGDLWWVWDDEDARRGGPLAGAYTGIGAFGQFLTVIPRLNMVIAHKTLPDDNHQVSVKEYLKLVRLLVDGARPPAR
jgi:CubicO group peptidase (beta-lactamase class C family)